jgi:hypothetical protein
MSSPAQTLGSCVPIPLEARIIFRFSSLFQSESELYNDRRSVGQSVLVSSPHLGLMTRFLLLSDHWGFLLYGAPSLTRGRICFLQCTIYSNVSDLRLPQPRGPGPCIYIPQEQGGPVIPPGTGFLSSSRFVSVVLSRWWPCERDRHPSKESYSIRYIFPD